MVIALVPQHAEQVAPPRTLTVPFPLGRPLGAPDDHAFQHRVLDAALELLTRTDAPVLEDFDEDAPGTGADEQPWVCPVSFAPSAGEATAASLVHEEMALLRPWHDQGDVQLNAPGLSGLQLSEAVDFVAGFVADRGAADKRHLAIDRAAAEQLKHAVEDIKAFYNRAAVNQPGRLDIQALEDWYWGETQAGKLVRAVRLALQDHEDKRVVLTAGLLLVPGSQTYRDEVDA